MSHVVVTYRKSAIGSSARQQGTLAALGLRRLRQNVTHVDNPALRGMVNAVRHLVSVDGVAADSSHFQWAQDSEPVSQQS